MRRKFLKSERTEYQLIVETIRKLSLSHFDVQFTLIHNDRNQMALEACDDSNTSKVQRLKKLFPQGFTDQLLTITTDDQGYFGTGGAQADSDTIDITVNAVCPGLFETEMVMENVHAWG